MTDCQGFSSTSETSLWYSLDPDTVVDIPGTFTWHGIPMTGESLDATLSSTISEIITPQRSYAGSKLTQGEVGGDLNFELQASPFAYNMLIAALQADQALDMGSDQVAGTDGVVVSAVGTLVDDDRTVTLTGLTATEGASYSVVIDGENFTYVAGATPTTSSIATGLAALIDADSVYASTAATDVITISAGAGLSDIEFTSFTPASWAPGEALVNGSTKKCLTFLKRIRVGQDLYDWYIFRGVQVGGVTLNISSGALITGTVTLSGLRPDTAVESTVLPVGWTFNDFPAKDIMSGVDSLKSFSILTSAGVDTGATFSDITLTFDNQLRQQQAVGLGHPFSAGVASGRFMASVSGTAYYSSPRIYNDFLADANLKVTGVLQDGQGEGFSFLTDFCKVTSGSIPQAAGADQDLTVSTELRAFESASNGTVKITRLAA